MAKEEHICPKCSSKNWKFPSPTSPSESMLNIPEMVNHFYECKDCGYVGVFFVKDIKKKMIKK